MHLISCEESKFTSNLFCYLVIENTDYQFTGRAKKTLTIASKDWANDFGRKARESSQYVRPWYKFWYSQFLCNKTFI